MRLPLKDIKPNPDNPRIIKDDKFEKLVQSLKDLPEMAEVREIVVNKDHMILGGNMRYKAMQAAGWTEAPVKVVDWPEDKQKQFIVKDNVSGGEWDWDAIANQYELEDLEAWGVDLPDALTSEEEVEEDEAPPIANVAVSKLGEIYQLGRHRVMCGDSTVDADKLFDTATIAFTSPPYNVGHNLGYKNKDNKYNEYDDNNDDWLNLLSTFQAAQEGKTEYQFINLQFLANNKRPTIEFLFSNIDKFVDVIFWKKSQVAPAMAKNVINSQTECIWVFRNEDKPTRAINTGSFRGDVTNIIETSSASTENDNSDIHNATMPVSLASYFVKNFTQKGDSVYDAFIGTGTTLIACEQTDRTCYGMEIDPDYVDVIRKRYAKFINNGELPDNWAELTPEIAV